MENELEFTSADIQKWESGQLGKSTEHAVLDSAATKALDDALGMQSISIRLPTRMIQEYKLVAAHHGIGYQPLMRDILQRWIPSGLQEILKDAESRAEQADERLADFEQRRVA